LESLHPETSAARRRRARVRTLVPERAAHGGLEQEHGRPVIAEGAEVFQ
jgi:hypothetical protein